MLNIRIILVVGIVLRIGVAVWNGFFGPSLGAELDAHTFYDTAYAGARFLTFEPWSVGPNYYINFLMTLLWLINDSLFFASLVSCVAWLVAAIFLVKSAKLLDVSGRWRAIPLWVFALAPTSILNTAVTLREPFQLLFVNIAIYAALRICLTKNNAYWLLFVLGCAGAGVLHGGLIGFVIGFFPSTLFFAMAIGEQEIPWGRIALAVVAGAILVPVGLSLFSNYGYDLSVGLGEASLSYQEGSLAIDARANYKVLNYDAGLIGTAWGLVIGYFQYLLEPLPWNIGNVADLGLFLENMVRAWLMYLSYRSIRVATGSLRISLIYILAMFMGMELVWSIGVVNWGTASRHHVPALGLLVLAASIRPQRRQTASAAEGLSPLPALPRG